MLPWVCNEIDHRSYQKGLEHKWNTWLHLVCLFFVLSTFWHHLWYISEQTHSKIESWQVYYDGVHNMDSLLWNQSLIVPATYPLSLEEMVHPNGTS